MVEGSGACCGVVAAVPLDELDELEPLSVAAWAMPAPPRMPPAMRAEVRSHDFARPEWVAMRIAPWVGGWNTHRVLVRDELPTPDSETGERFARDARERP
jgi:hypothetical protein